MGRQCFFHCVSWYAFFLPFSNCLCWYETSMRFSWSHGCCWRCTSTMWRSWGAVVARRKIVNTACSHVSLLNCDVPPYALQPENDLINVLFFFIIDRILATIISFNIFWYVINGVFKKILNLTQIVPRRRWLNRRLFRVVELTLVPYCVSCICR